MPERDEVLIKCMKAWILACLEEDDHSYQELLQRFDQEFGESMNLPFIQALFDLRGEGRIDGSMHHMWRVKGSSHAQ